MTKLSWIQTKETENRLKQSKLKFYSLKTYAQQPARHVKNLNIAQN